MEGTTNPIELDMFTDLQRPHGDVMDGADTETQNATMPLDPALAFLTKCIHPPSAVGGYLGLPTNDTRAQVTPEYPFVGIMKTPRILDYSNALVRDTTPEDLVTFNYAILNTNGGRVLGIPFIYNRTVTGPPTPQLPNSEMQQDFNNVMTTEVYNFDNFANDVMTYRTAYKSMTAYMNATQFNDTGMVTGAQFNPPLLFAGTVIQMNTEKPDLFYDFMLSEHVRCGKVVIGKKHPDYLEHKKKYHALPRYVVSELREQLGIDGDDLPSLDPNTTIQVVHFGAVRQGVSIVPTPSQLMAMSERSWTGKAKEGAFVVQRLNTLTPEWLTAGNTNNNETNGLYLCYQFFKDSTGDTHFVPFYDNTVVGTPGANLPVLRDTLWSKDMTWSWTIFQGLSLNPQTAGTTEQLLIFKYLLGLELQPSPSSAFAGLTKLAPKPDAGAMQALMARFYAEKDCKPACYNFLGGLASALGPILKDVAGSALGSIASSVLKKRDEPQQKKEKQPKIQKKINKMENRVENKLMNEMAQMRNQMQQMQIRRQPVYQNTKRTVIGPPTLNQARRIGQNQRRRARNNARLQQYIPILRENGGPTTKKGIKKAIRQGREILI